MANSSPKLGQLITKHVGRDAIHIAIAPVQCGDEEGLEPAQRIKIDRNSKQAVSAEDWEFTAIVDPWLIDGPRYGQWFWALLNPNTITALRHYWTHPDFPDLRNNEEKQNALEWMIQFAQDLGVNSHGRTLSVDELLSGADQWLADGEYTRWGYDDTYITDEFWVNYEIIRGIIVDPGNRQDFFECDC